MKFFPEKSPGFGFGLNILPPKSKNSPVSLSKTHSSPYEPALSKQARNLFRCRQINYLLRGINCLKLLKSYDQTRACIGIHRNIEKHSKSRKHQMCDNPNFRKKSHFFTFRAQNSVIIATKYL